MADTKSEPIRKESAFKKLYLVAYNSALVIAWSLVLLKSAIFISERKDVGGLYNEVEYWLKVAQTAAVMEIVHALVGLVKSSVFTTFPQVLSRLGVLWIILESIIMKNHSTHDTIGFPLLLFAWTITEIVRYTFYTNTLLDNLGYTLKWCRYSLFIVLYPMGVAGEIVCILSAMSAARKSGQFSVTLPNKFNFSFDFVTSCYFILLLYPPGFYFLYSHMLRQRKKVLGTKDKKL